MSYINLKDSSEYNAYTNNGNNLVAGDIYIVENPSECHFRTNNINGDKVYNYDSSEDLIKNLCEDNVESIIIPEGTSKIRDGAFYGCRNLKSISIPNSVTTIGHCAFEYCNSLPSITIPNGVISFGNFAFYKCSSLTSLNLPDSVTTINQYAFESCTSLTDVTIGSGVTSIGEGAFYLCSALTSVTVLATTPPTLDYDVFKNNANGRKIYVPAASVNAYKAATNWKSYASAIYPIE